MADFSVGPRTSTRWVWMAGVLVFDIGAAGVEYSAHAQAALPPSVVVAPAAVHMTSARGLAQVEALARLVFRTLRQDGVPLPTAPATPAGPIVGTLQAILAQALPRPP